MEGAEKLPSKITLFSCIKRWAMDPVKSTTSEPAFSTFTVAQEGQTSLPADTGYSGHSSLMRLETDFRHIMWIG